MACRFLSALVHQAGIQLFVGVRVLPRRHHLHPKAGRTANAIGNIKTAAAAAVKNGGLGLLVCCILLEPMLHHLTSVVDGLG